MGDVEGEEVLGETEDGDEGFCGKFCRKGRGRMLGGGE